MSAIPPASAMNTILQLMLANKVSLWDLMKTMLSTPQPNYQPIKDSLQQHAVDICCLLFSSVGCREIVFSWALEIVVEVLCEEIVDLSSECNGLHFKLSKTTSTQLEDSFMRTLALKIKKAAPNVFKILLALLDANPGRRRKFLVVDITEMLREYKEGVHKDKEMDLGEFGGDDSARVIDVLAHAGFSISTQSIMTAVKSLSKEAGVQIKQAVQTLTTALAYDNFNIDFKTAQPTIEHQSQFISLTSATAIPLYGVDDPAVLCCLQEIRQRELSGADNKDLHARKTSPGMFATSCSTTNGNPAIVNAIPLHKTTQIPCRAMPIEQSTTDGNIEVMDSLLRQGRIGECEDVNFDPQYDVDMSEHVLLVHGDLLTKEQLDVIVKS
ncbi:hypothetical protein EV424DRAFT_1348494 [Suillus variegatus]|nr:hypothetical protein EV424DRAFT_1348494 [Suillus variegatus]